MNFSSKFFGPRLFHVFKLGYSLEKLRNDFFAGLTVAIVAFPLAMALAVASGTTPEKGLITAIVAGFIISALGGSRTQIGGPTGAFVVIVFEIIQIHGFSGLVVATFLAGIMLIVAGLLRLGAIIKYIPQTVIIGFTAGIATIIFSTQIKDFFGLYSIEKIPSDFLHQWTVYFQNISSLHLPTLLIAFTSLILIILSKNFFPKIPIQIIVVALGALIAVIFTTETETIYTKFGDLPSVLPYPSFPEINLALIIKLLPAAFTIAFLAGLESLLSAIIADSMTGDRHHSNTELIAQGAANVTSALFLGLPATGAIARTAVNIRSGAKTPIAGMLHAIILLFFMWIFSDYVSLIPLACLAAILIMVAWNMSEAKEFFKMIVNSPWTDKLTLLCTYLLTIFTNITISISVGVILATLIFMHRMTQTTKIRRITSISENEKKKISENIHVYNIEGPFFFGSAASIRSVLDITPPENNIFIFNMENISFFDTTASYAFKLLIKEITENNGHVVISGSNEDIYHLLKVVGVKDIVPKPQITETIHQALKVANALKVRIKGC